MFTFCLADFSVQAFHIQTSIFKQISLHYFSVWILIGIPHLPLEVLL